RDGGFRRPGGAGGRGPGTSCLGRKRMSKSLRGGGKCLAAGGPPPRRAREGLCSPSPSRPRGGAPRGACFWAAVFPSLRLPFFLAWGPLPMQQRRLLIVDDNEVNRNQIKHLVETEYLQVDTVGDGAAALHALVANNYSVVITDLRMPRISGMKMIEEVQKQR